MNPPDHPPAHTPGFAELMAADSASRRWPPPPVDPALNPEPMTDAQRAINGTEIARRDARSDALTMAVYLREGIDAEGALRAMELDEVISDARRFYEYLWEGK